MGRVTSCHVFQPNCQFGYYLLTLKMWMLMRRRIWNPTQRFGCPTLCAMGSGLGYRVWEVLHVGQCQQAWLQNFSLVWVLAAES